MLRSTRARFAGREGFPIGRLLAVAGIALATANCSTNPAQKLAANGSGIDPKYGVKASPRLYNEGDVIPKGGGRRFSGKPYVVAGRTYVPREEGRGYVREGLASWYGSAFHGRMTANGEVFDRHSIAAAHPTLPLPSYARVTNLANGRSMVVRVNDRGPYHADRVMDVSEAVAEALEFHRRGTSKVRVEYVGKASVAGSDDRKLLATLRTDGRPAPIGGASPVMLADLGPDRDTGAGDGLARGRAPLAFQPGESAEPAQAAPAPRRAAPIQLAGATVAVPPALQPGARREGAFKPVLPHATGRPLAVAELGRSGAPDKTKGAEPSRVAALAPPSRSAASGKATGAKARGIQGEAIKVAGLNPGLSGREPAKAVSKASQAQASQAQASKAPAMPAAARQQMARLASLPAEPPRRPALRDSASQTKPAPARRSRFAGIDN